MRGFQTTLLANKIPELEKFADSHCESLHYILEKYLQWKELKQKEAVRNANRIQEPKTL